MPQSLSMSQQRPPVAPASSASEAAARAMCRRRIAGGLICGAAFVVLILAARLQPSPNGLGTHSSLGLPACGWIRIADTPCPTCGMTTAFAHAADGNLAASFRTQPMGGLLALVTAAALLAGAYVTLTGSTLIVVMMRRWRPRATWALIAFVVGAWIYKMLSYRGVI